MITVNRIYTSFFFIGIFFFSFNDYEGLPILGEFKKEAGAIFFLLGFILLVIEAIYVGKINIPFKNIIFQIIIIFVIWCFLSVVLNLYSVTTNYYKHTTGINRFTRQYISLLISVLFFFLFYYNVLIKMSVNDILFKIRKVFLLSLIVASLYGFLETLIVYFGFYFLIPILKLFNYFPFLEVFIDHGGRISSICYEPPFFAIYLITIAGWMFSYVLTSKTIFRFIPMLIVLILTYFTGSRTGLIVIFIQLILFATILYKDVRYRNFIYNSIRVFLIVFSALLLINGSKITKSITEKANSLNFSRNLTKNVSNKSRFGMQYAALMVFKDNPLAGVGFGQQTYHAKFYYPGWATKDNYEFTLYYKNSAEPSFPPGYNIYTRILAETGLIGFLIFAFLIYTTIKMSRKMIHSTSEEIKILSIILFITLAGLFINWLQIDTFRMYGVWISIAILIRLMKTNALNYEK